jgi:V8-like Glu-specific endopeptidase
MRDMIYVNLLNPDGNNKIGQRLYKKASFVVLSLIIILFSPAGLTFDIKTQTQILISSNDDLKKFYRGENEKAMIQICSSFYGNFQGQDYLFTAKHCINANKSTNGNSPHFKNFMVSSNFIGSFYEGFDLHTSSEDFSPVFFSDLTSLGQNTVDASFHKANAKELENVTVLNIAKEKPKLGAKLRVTGYPSGIGPISFNCIQLGYNTLTAQSDDSANTIHPAMRCKNISKTVHSLNLMQGMSGSPVMNQNNEIIGILVIGFENKDILEDIIAYQDLTTVNLKKNNNNLEYVPTFSDGRHVTYSLNEDDEKEKIDFEIKNDLFDGKVTYTGSDGETLTEFYNNGVLEKK